MTRHTFKQDAGPAGSWILSLTLVALLALIGCQGNSPPPPQLGVSTLSTYMILDGDVPEVVADMTAYTVADGLGCNANGFGNQGGGIVSASAGYCYFPMLYTETTYPFQFNIPSSPGCKSGCVRKRV